MYYVLQVAPGTEERTEKLIRGQVGSSAYGRCFHPIRHVRKKFRGEWKDFHEKLLPGYVFITSDSVRELYQELRQVPALTRMLGKEDEWFAALPESEAAWLECLMQINENVLTEIGLSQVLTEEGGMTILSGPLKHMEGNIKKFHLHKRLAAVDVEFMGRKTEIYLGIELVKERQNCHGAG